MEYLMDGVEILSKNDISINAYWRKENKNE